MIEIKKLKAHNDEKVILDIENFAFRNDESYLIAGENGSGKSSFIKILANDIDEGKYQNLKINGEILVDGKDILSSISNREEFNKEMCYVSQEDQFLTNNIGKELLLYYNLANDKNISQKDIISTIKELNIEDLLMKTFFKSDLSEILKLKISFLSGGQKKIVHIVRELVKNKEAQYLFFDEPLNNLDVKNITFISNLINKISNNKLLIMISHCKIFPFIKKAVKLTDGMFQECTYNCLSCFGKSNDNGYYQE